MIRYLGILTSILVLLASFGFGEDAAATEHVYVAPNLIQSRDAGIFTTLALTNTTEFWFNPRIYLVNTDGEVVVEFAPLLKGFATWQRSSVDFIPDDFQGSIWIVSSQPIVATSFMHQFRPDGTLSLLGNTELRILDGAASQAMALRASAAR